MKQVQNPLKTIPESEKLRKPKVLTDDTHSSLVRRHWHLSAPSGHTRLFCSLATLIIIIIIIIIIIVSFMQCIYTYIPETNHVPKEYSVAAILLLLFMVLISLVSVLNLLYFYSGAFRSMCAVPSMAVFCSSFTSCFPGMLLTYFHNDFEIVPVAQLLLVSPLILHSTCVVFIIIVIIISFLLIFLLWV